MWGVGKHIDRLDGGNVVVGVEVVQVAGLCGRITRYIDDALRSSAEDGFYHIGMHAGTRRVGDDDIGATMFGDELIGEDVFHIAREEERVGDAVDLGVYFRVLDGLRDIFDANDLSGLTGHEIGDGAGAGLEVVNQWLLARRS